MTRWVLALLLLVSAPVLGQYTEVDSQTTDDARTDIRDSSDDYYVGQTFTASEDYELDRVTITLQTVGTPSGSDTIHAEIWTTSGGLPSAIISGATSDTIAISAIDGFPRDEHNFDFGTPPSLSSGTLYAIVLVVSYAESVDGLGIGRETTGSYANGQACAATSAPSWSCGTADIYFRTWTLGGGGGGGGGDSDLIVDQSFETVSPDGTDPDHELDWAFDHYFEFAAGHGDDCTSEDGYTGDGEGGAAYAIDTSVYRSGSKSIRLEITDIFSSRRAQFALNLQSEGYFTEDGDSFFLRVWVYVPADTTFDYIAGGNWWEFANPHSHGGQPYSRVRIATNEANNDWEVSLAGRDSGGGAYTVDAIDPWPDPRGKWTRLEWLVVRGDGDGTVSLWVDQALVATDSTLETYNGTLITIPAKLYYDCFDETPKEIWFDDLQVWDGFPDFQKASRPTGATLQ